MSQAVLSQALYKRHENNKSHVANDRAKRRSEEYVFYSRELSMKHGKQNFVLYLVGILCIVLYDVPLRAMHLYDYFTDEFKSSKHQQHLLEYTVYKLLKEKPLKANINYLAVPWIELDATGKLYDKNWMNAYNLPKRLARGFTVCTYFNGPNDTYPETHAIFTLLKQMGVNCVFTTDAFNTVKNYMGIRIMPLPLHVQSPVDPNTPKDIICSFIGFNTYPLREYATKLGELDNYYIKLRDHARAFYFTSEKDKRFLREEYADILARSRFSLCPRGFEPGIFRFWESLQAGSIPILISDEWRLPGSRRSWKNSIIRIKESDFKEDPFIVDRVIRAITPEQEIQRRKACLAMYEKYSGENLVSVIRKFYDGVA